MMGVYTSTLTVNRSADLVMAALCGSCVWGGHSSDCFSQALAAVVEQERPHVLGVQEIRIGAVIGDKCMNGVSPTMFLSTVEELLPNYDTICESVISYDGAIHTFISEDL